MELICLTSIYLALYILMMCCSVETSLSNMKSRLRTVPANSILVLLKETFSGWREVVVTEDDHEKRIASVLLFSSSLCSSIHSLISVTQAWSEQTKSENLSCDSEWSSCVSSANILWRIDCCSMRHANDVVYKAQHFTSNHPWRKHQEEARCASAYIIIIQSVYNSGAISIAGL